MNINISKFNSAMYCNEKMISDVEKEITHFENLVATAKTDISNLAWSERLSELKFKKHALEMVLGFYKEAIENDSESTNEILKEVAVDSSSDSEFIADVKRRFESAKKIRDVEKRNVILHELMEQLDKVFTLYIIDDKTNTEACNLNCEISNYRYYGGVIPRDEEVVDEELFWDRLNNEDLD